MRRSSVAQGVGCCCTRRRYRTVCVTGPSCYRCLIRSGCPARLRPFRVIGYNAFCAVNTKYELSDTFSYVFLGNSFPPKNISGATNLMWRKSLCKGSASGQSSLQLSQRFRFRFPTLPNFLISSGSGTVSTQPLW
jgi:hypothetical protein